MYRALIIIINKFLTKLCHLFHKNGSVYPGSITFNMNRRILTKIKYPRYVIGVTGSSGKGTTSNLIYQVLKNEGLKVVFNTSGSNGVRALTTLILNNCNIFGKMKADVLLLEIDERHIHMAFPKDTLTHLVITNVTRDQPARNHHVDSILDYIFKKITNYTKLIINADDPVLYSYVINKKCHITKYGLSKNSYSYTDVKINNLDHIYCPKCHTKLIYEYYHYGPMGNYYCPNGCIKRDPLKYEATNIDLNNKTFQIEKNKINIPNNALYSVYAYLSAYTLLREIGISEKQIINTFNSTKSKRGNQYTLYDKPFIMLESKNENSLSYYQSLKQITDDTDSKNVILGFENVSRRYKFNDLSWLYDVEFELLKNKTINKIIIIGRFKYDILTRLSYANIDPSKIILVNELNDIKDILKDNPVKTYTMVCFDMTYMIKSILKEDLKND